jgi:hypothetical protein
MEDLLLKIVFIIIIILLIVLFVCYLCKGLLVNYTASLSAVFSDTANSSSSNGHKFINSSFENLKSTGEHPASIGVWDANAKYNVTNCFFRNISGTLGNPRAGSFHCNMNNNNNFGYYNLSENTFINIGTNKSAIQLSGSFSSFIFSYNSFFNVSSVYEGGVFKIY